MCMHAITKTNRQVSIVYKAQESKSCCMLSINFYRISKASTFWLSNKWKLGVNNSCLTWLSRTVTPLIGQPSRPQLSGFWNTRVSDWFSLSISWKTTSRRPIWFSGRCCRAPHRYWWCVWQRECGWSRLAVGLRRWSLYDRSLFRLQ